MSNYDIKAELKQKERTISDLLRFIETRTDNNPNYSLLLGSGCSVTSGIRSGGQLIWDWRKEIYCNLSGKNEENYNEKDAINYLKQNHGSWYNESNEYSSLFEKKYDLPRQRRMFVEQEVSSKTPSIGYAYLINLVKKSYFNTIFTTNFDDLLNEAFYQFSEDRPMVCAHDSSINSITVTSKRPKIIKLHGDYLFDDIKSTLRETESLEENIRNKFIEFSKDYGLVVAGYGGHDRSIMDVLNYLLKHEDYYKSGIYWCLRKGDEIGEELRKLLWKDKVYFVEIDGFDELFAELHNSIYKGKLPIDTSFISNKSQDIIQRFISNDKLKDTKSEIIKNDLSNLISQNEKNSLYEAIKDLQSDDKFGRDDFENKEVKTLVEIASLFKQQSFDETLKIIDSALMSTSNKKFSIELYDKKISVYNRLGDIESVNKIYDSLIQLDPNNPIHFIKKAEFVNELDEKLALIDQALDIDAFYDSIYNRKTLLLIDKFDTTQKNEEEFDTILNLLNKSLEVNPSIDNNAWAIKFDFIYSMNEKDSNLEDIVTNLEKQNPYSIDFLNMKYKLLPDDDDKKKDFIKTILEAEEKHYSDDKFFYKNLQLNVLDDLNDKEEIRKILTSMGQKEIYESNYRFLNQKAVLLFEKFDELEKAIDILYDVLKIKRNSITVKNLLIFLLYANKGQDAEKIFNNYKYLLSHKDIIFYKKNYYEFLEKFREGLNEVEKLKKYGFIDQSGYVMHKSFFLLLDKDYEGAKEFLKEFLSTRNFSLSLYAEIINYEFACRMLNGKYNHKRISTLKENKLSNRTKAAIAALEGNKSETYKYIETEIKINYREKYEFRNWPVFSLFSEEEKFKSLLF